MLQQQVTALADTQHSTDDRFGRSRQENAVLQARLVLSIDKSHFIAPQFLSRISNDN